MRLGGVNVRLIVAMTLGLAPLPDRGHAQVSAPAGPESIDHSQFELRAVEGSRSAAEERRRKIEGEIEAIRNDRARLSSALIETTNRERAASTRVDEVRRRLDTALASETAIRRSLDARRDVIADVLAALQRIGRRPPPAVLASPDDILRAVRASMLLGATLPELRVETEALAADLADLIRIRRGIVDEQEQLDRDKASLAEERQRLSALIEARQGSLVEAERAREAEAAKIAELARQATDLKDLIARVELELGAAARGAAAARKADDDRTKLAMGPVRDPARLAPALAFVDAKASLPFPVSGSIARNFGASDGFGGTERGVVFTTGVGAIVSSPCDGWISYTGPWRSFGQIVIVNAGGGYYVVLAGMNRSNVNIGQFVLAGEPIAAMGDGSVKSAVALAIGVAQPVLYVEFWKDGAAIDPGPWWAKQDFEKVRG